MKKIIFIFLIISSIFFVTKARTFLFIGDSITDGNWGSPDKYPCPSEERNLWDKNHILGHGYVEMVAGCFMGEHPDSSNVFINRGISGETLQQIANRWDKDVIAHYPDIISLLCGTNDVHYWLENHPKGIEDFDFSSYRATLDSLVDYTLNVFPESKIYIGTPFVAKAGWAGQSEDYELRKNTVDSIARLTKNYIENKRNPSLRLVDFNSLKNQLVEEYPDEEYWMWDGIHPTSAMHYRMAKHWLENFKN